MFGAGEYGQLGTGRMDRENIPVQIKFSSRIRKVACGQNHTLALTEAGKIYGTGGNLSGQLGIGTKKISLVFVKIVASEHVVFKKIAAGSHSGAISTQGELYLWGAGAFGEYLTPQRITGFKTALKRVSIGNGFGCATDTKGNIYSWGHNNHGELGSGDYESRLHPKQIPSLDGKRVTSVACGGSFVIALGNTLHYGREDTDSSQTERELSKPFQEERVSYHSQSRRTDKFSERGDSVSSSIHRQRNESVYEEDDINSSIIYNKISLEKSREHNESKRLIYNSASGQQFDKEFTASFAKSFPKTEPTNLILSKRQSFAAETDHYEAEKPYKLPIQPHISLKTSPDKPRSHHASLSQSFSRDNSRDYSRDHSRSRMSSSEKYNSLPIREKPRSRSPNQTEVSSASPNRSPIKLEATSIAFDKAKQNSSEKNPRKKITYSGLKNPALRKKATPEKLKSDPKKGRSPSLKQKFDRLTDQILDKSPSRNLSFNDASFSSVKEENNKTIEAQHKEIAALKKIIYDLRTQISTLEKENSSIHEKVLVSKIQNLEENCTALKQVGSALIE